METPIPYWRRSARFTLIRGSFRSVREKDTLRNLAVPPPVRDSWVFVTQGRSSCWILRGRIIRQKISTVVKAATQSSEASD